MSSVWCKCKFFTDKISEDILANELNEPTDYYIIHWDTKKFKALKHTDENQEKISILLTSTNGNEILLGIPQVKDGTAAEEHKIIINLLKEKNINLKKIIGVVFDTKSVNNGEISGIVRRLEDALGHPIIEMACRHHNYELVCGAASEIVLGKTDIGKK